MHMNCTNVEQCADTYLVKTAVVEATVGVPASKKRRRNDSADACGHGGRAAKGRQPKRSIIERQPKRSITEAVANDPMAVEGEAEEGTRPTLITSIEKEEEAGEETRPTMITSGENEEEAEEETQPTLITAIENEEEAGEETQPTHITSIEKEREAEEEDLLTLISSSEKEEEAEEEALLALITSIEKEEEAEEGALLALISSSEKEEEAEEETLLTLISSSEKEEEAEEETLLTLISSRNKQAKTYAHVKAAFERICFRVESPYTFVKLPKHKVPGKMPDTLSVEKVKSYFADVQYWVEEVSGEGNTNWVAKGFIHKWLQDPSKREVSEIVVDPRCTRRGVYNLWEGYLAEALPHVPDGEVEGLVEPIIRHIREVMANDNKDHTNYVIDWIANIIQKPWEKTNVAIMLYGKEGCGKGIIIDWLRNSVLGSHCTYQTSDPDNDIFGRFAAGLINKVLVQIDEVKALHAHADKLKNIITCDTIRSEKKGADSITVNNFANLIFTSNNDNALAVATDARRFVLFKCSAKYKGNKAYFTGLRKHLAKAEVAQALYQFMMKRDLSVYEDGFQEYRPITQFYKEAQKKSISTTNNFLSACVNTLEACVHDTLDEGITKTLGGRRLYDLYRKFCLQSGLKQDFIKTENSFGTDLSHVEGVCKKRNCRGILYTLDRDAIKKYLEDAKEYNEEVYLRPDS